MTWNQKIGVLIALSLTGVVITFSYPAIPQDPSYFRLADCRHLWSIANFGDVVSNLAFFGAGMMGLVLLFRVRQDRSRLITPQEFYPFLFAYAGIALIFPGSAYFHFDPGNETLVWDRLPMTLVFMSVFAMVLTERLQLRRPGFLLIILLMLGVGSVVYWHFTEQAGRGDLRLYGLVQYLPLLLYPFLFSWFPPRYSGTRYLLEMLGWYLVAKLFEFYDEMVWSWTGEVVSGHSIKHLCAAVATYGLVRYLKHRRSLVTEAHHHHPAQP